MTYKILCCDGGGIRGLITALLIENLEDVFDGFIVQTDGFAGTSTGGLISLGLAHGKAIGEIVDIYKTKGAEIFTPNGWTGAKPELGAPPKSEAEAEALAGPGKFNCQYKANGLKKLAEELLGNDELRDSEKMIAVTAAQLWDDSLQSWRSRTLSSLPGNPFREVRMVDAALATSAAPTYFPPHEIAAFSSYFADGGVFANNPAMSAVAEAVGGGLIKDLGDVRVLSLGTGQDPQGIPPAVFEQYKPLSWGATKWLWPSAWATHVPEMALISLMFAATSASATAQAEQLLGAKFCRANVPIKAPYALDDYQNVAKLEDWTTDYMAGPTWRAVREWVEANWT